MKYEIFHTSLHATIVVSFKGTGQSSLISFDLRRRLAINIGLFHVGMQMCCLVLFRCI